MKTLTIYLVRLPEVVREICLQAARHAFPQAQCLPVRSVEAALQQPAIGRQLLVFAGADEEECNLAAQAVEVGDLPRWAVIRLGRDASDLFETIPPEDWTVRQLARIFRSTLMQYDLLRENIQLRGDLKTVTRRVTHDTRTPLGCILTVCEAFKAGEAGGGLSPQETTEMVRSATQEICRLVDRVSFVLKATLNPLSRVALTMEPLVHRALQQLQPVSEKIGKRIDLPPRWPEAEGVPEWIEFIWTHLIENALLHSTKSSTVQLGWEQRATEIRFWVSSQGTVPATRRARLLLPFHTLHQHTSAGLSLSLVERLVSLQNGRCGYESTSDGRALFFFTLPLARHQLSPSEPTPAPTAQPVT